MSDFPQTTNTDAFHSDAFHSYVPLGHRGDRAVFKDVVVILDGKPYSTSLPALAASGTSIVSPIITGFHKYAPDAEALAAYHDLLFALGLGGIVLWQIVAPRLRDFSVRVRGGRKEIETDLWPVSLAKATGEYRRYLESKLVLLNQEPGKSQFRNLLADAKESITAVRIAFTEDLGRLKDLVEKLQQGCSLHIAAAHPRALKPITDYELRELDRLESEAQILTNLEGEDVQARQKYLRAPLANFARAATDALITMQSLDCLTNYDLSFEHRKRFRLSLYEGEPTFCGTISDHEIFFSETPKWQPGMLGKFHLLKRHSDTQTYWRQLQRDIDKEFRSMKPKETSLSGAIEIFETEALAAVDEAAPKRGTATLDMIKDLKSKIARVKHMYPRAGHDLPSTLSELITHRMALRVAFASIFEPMTPEVA